MSTVVDWPCEWQGIRWFSGPRISKVTRVLGRLASWDDEIWSTDDLGMGSTCFHESFRSDTFFQQIIYDSIYDDTLWYYDSIYDDTLVSLASSGNGRCWLRMSPVTERAAPSSNWQVWARSKRKFPDTAGLTNNSERGWRYFFWISPVCVIQHGLRWKNNTELAMEVAAKMNELNRGFSSKLCLSTNG